MNFLDRKETLEYLTKHKTSIVRFGDGEMMLMLGSTNPSFKGIPFQNSSPLLANKLLNLWQSEDARFLLCYNLNFMMQSRVKVILKFENAPKEYYTFETVREPNDIGVLERSQWQQLYKIWYSFVSQHCRRSIIGEATCFWLGYFIKEYTEDNLIEICDLYKSLFTNKRILFVTPEKPNRGKSFKELIEEGVIASIKDAFFLNVPSTNAFEKYESLLEKIVLEQNNFDVVFIQAGPTATALAGELCLKHNITAYDVGTFNVTLEKAFKHLQYQF